MTLQSGEVSPVSAGNTREAHLVHHAKITDQQLECLAWAQEGKSAVDIGEILGVSPRTVEKRLARICQHLGVRTRIQAVSKAKDLGLLGRLSQ